MRAARYIRTPPRIQTGSASRRRLIGFLLAVATLAIYWQAISFEFTNFDDPGYVYENPQVAAGLTAQGARWAFTTTREANWHPLTWLSLMLDAEIGGAGPRVYHLTSLLLHAANSLLLFLLLDRMTGRTGRSGFVAALFAVHPLHVESVAWVAERKDVLSTLFWLLTMMAYIAYVRTPNAGRYALVVLSLAAGLLAKPMLVTLPLALLLLDVWPLGRAAFSKGAGRDGTRRFSRLLLEKTPLFALAAASAIATLIAQRKGGAVRTLELYPISVRAANAVVSYVRYLEKMLWPTSLSPYYPQPHEAFPTWQVAICALFLIAATIWALRAARMRPYLMVGWLWYLITLLPVIGLVQVGSQAMADRYTYVPLIGPFIIIAWGIFDLLAVADHGKRKTVEGQLGLSRLRTRVCIAGALVCVLLLMTRARIQTRVWHDSVSLFESALKVEPENPIAHGNLAMALFDRGRVDEAVSHCSEALRIAPGFADAHFNLARGLMKLGKTDEASRYCREELRLWPADERSHVNIALILMGEGRLDEAAGQLTEALRLRPDSVDAHLNLASILLAQGRRKDAIAHFSEASRLNPADTDARTNLKRLLSDKGSGG